MSALHYGHPGRDTMLRGIADIWWPKCHREVINTAKFCEDCSKADKNVKVLQKQSEFGKIPRSIAPNEEIAIDFTGPFQNAKQGKIICLYYSITFQLGRTHCFYKNNNKESDSFFKELYGTVWGSKEYTVGSGNGIYEQLF